MPEHRLMVDVETLLVGILEADATFGALVGGPGDAARVSTELPADFAAEPRLRLFRVGGTFVDQATAYIDRAVIQTDSYGATGVQAWQVAAEAFAALLRARGSHAGAVIVDVERLDGPTWFPDPESDVPRYVSTIAVTVHPTG